MVTGNPIPLSCKNKNPTKFNKFSHTTLVFSNMNFKAHFHNKNNSRKLSNVLLFFFNLFVYQSCITRRTTLYSLGLKKTIFCSILRVKIYKLKKCSKKCVHTTTVTLLLLSLLHYTVNCILSCIKTGKLHGENHIYYQYTLYLFIYSARYSRNTFYIFH